MKKKVLEIKKCCGSKKECCGSEKRIAEVKIIVTRKKKILQQKILPLRSIKLWNQYKYIAFNIFRA